MATQPIGQVKADVIETNDNEVRESHFFKPRSKPFNDSGLEGGIAFIYEWKKRNATLSNNEIVMLAVNGILAEGRQSRRECQTEHLAEMLMAVKNESDKKIFQCCIRLYSFDSFLYRVVNSSLRENDKTRIDTLAPFCYLLTEAIWSDVFRGNRIKSVVYRGFMLDPDSMQHFEEGIGTYKCWYGFTSSSTDREVADCYGNSLFIIDASRTGGLNISSYSHYSHEEEVILPPGTTFRIDKVDRRDDKTYIYICTIPEVRMVLLGRTGTGKNRSDFALR